MRTVIFKTYEDFQNRTNKLLNGVSPEFANTSPDYHCMNLTNVGCWDCVDCTNCSYCEYCTDSVDCEHCVYCISCNNCHSCTSCMASSDCTDCNACIQLHGGNDDSYIF